MSDDLGSLWAQSRAKWLAMRGTHNFTIADIDAIDAATPWLVNCDRDWWRDMMRARHALDILRVEAERDAFAQAVAEQAEQAGQDAAEAVLIAEFRSRVRASGTIENPAPAVIDAGPIQAVNTITTADIASKY